MKNQTSFNTPSVVKSIASSDSRPLVSVMIPTYNCAKFLIKTLESVLSQDLGENLMEIEVIDDCSTIDNPELIVKQYGNGRVRFSQNQKNLGAPENFNTCINRSNGKLVHILHGDDYILPFFYQLIINEFEDDNDLGICITRSLIIDEYDNLIEMSPRISNLEKSSKNHKFLFYENPIRTPSIVVKREVYEKIGGFIPSLIHTSDWEMWNRAISSTKGLFLNKPLVCYRYFPSNDTGRLASTGDNLVDYIRLGNILKTKYQDFSFIKFYQNVVHLALNQAEMFKKLGNNDSYQTNYEIYKKLRKKLPLFLFIREHLKMYYRAFLKL